MEKASLEGQRVLTGYQVPHSRGPRLPKLVAIPRFLAYVIELMVMPCFEIVNTEEEQVRNKFKILYV